MVEHFFAAADEVQVTVGDRIEGAWVDSNGGFHNDFRILSQKVGKGREVPFPECDHGYGKDSSLLEKMARLIYAAL